MTSSQADRQLQKDLGFGCQHEYRQLKYRPEYISKKFEVKFYCIFCLETKDCDGEL